MSVVDERVFVELQVLDMRWTKIRYECDEDNEFIVAAA